MKILSPLIILLFCFISAYSQNKNYLDQPYIETMSAVDTLVTPDEIFLSITISEKDTKDKISVEKLELRMEETLKKLGIDTKENLMLNDLASNFKKYFLKSKDVLKRKDYTLKLNDAKMAGRVISELENLEIANVQLDHTDFSKTDELELQLKSKAISKAHKQAKYLVKPLGQKVGPAIYISDQSLHNSPRALQGQASGMMVRHASSLDEAEYKSADIEFEKIRFSTQVFVKFKLEE